MPFVVARTRPVAVSLFAATLVSALIPPVSSGAAEQPSLTAAQWKDDLRFLSAELTKRHSNLFHTLTRERFDEMVRSLESRIETLPAHAITIEMARITAAIGELHTGIALHRQRGALLAAFHAFPVRFQLFEDGLFVQAADATHREIVGARVVSIGQLSWEEAYRRTSGLVLADNEMGQAKFAPIYLSVAEALSTLGVTADAATLLLVVERPDGQRLTRNIPAAPLPTLLPLLNPEADPGGLPGVASARDGAAREVPLWLQQAGDRYWFRFLENTRTAYVRIDVMRDRQDESMSAFFRRVLSEIARRSTERLVVEIRRNNGGDNLALPLIEGLLARLALNQPGKILVLIGRGTVSSGQNLATLLERYTHAVFIGEPTAQRPNHYGVMFRFELPNSRISVTHSRYQLIDADADDVRAWLTPDVRVGMTSRDYAANRDPVFEAAMAYAPPPQLALAEDLADAYLPEFSLLALMARYKELRPRFLTARRFMEAELLKLGYNVLAWGKATHAVEVFALNVENEPNSDAGHAALGKAYFAAGRPDDAARSFARAVELNPWNRDAIAKRD
jgi:tetratricopeptide (TPR) repeat protein